MRFGPVPLAEAAGGILAHSILVGGRRWSKGRCLTAADLAAAAAAGVDSLVVAHLDPGDIDEDSAAARLAAALAGNGLHPLAASHGRANLAAAATGLLVFDPGGVRAINRIDEALTLATLAPGARVAAGDIVATIKVIRYAVPGAALAAAEAVCRPALGASQQISVAAFRPLTILLLATTLPGTGDKALAKTARVTRARVEDLGCRFIEAAPCDHSAEALTAAIAALPPHDLLLIVGASATVDRGDVIPAAIVAAGGRIERLGMPVDPGNLLCLGTIGDRPVIGLPGCARSPKRNGFDIVLERLVAGLDVGADDIAMMGVGGLLPEAERPEPRRPARRPDRVGVVILAAGRSSRMGGEHKLLADWCGRPLIAHVVDAVAAAGLPPPVVVLGTRGAEVREALGNRPAVFVTAAGHEDGLSRSLAAGLAAAPPAWQAALVCLGDMPRIEATLLRALADAPGEVIVPTWAGKRGNPVRWPRAHFARLMALTGDVGGKAVLADLPPPTEIAAPSDAVLDDIDTPEALATLRARLDRPG